MTGEPLDLDALETLYEYLQIDKSDFHLYDWNEGDEYGRIAIGILYNDTPICEVDHVEAYQGQQLIKLLKTIPRLIELARERENQYGDLALLLAQGCKVTHRFYMDTRLFELSCVWADIEQTYQAGTLTDALTQASGDMSRRIQVRADELTKRDE